MDLLSRIGTWLSDHEAMISAVVGITVLAGVLFAGVRALLLRGAGETLKKALARTSRRSSLIVAAAALLLGLVGVIAWLIWPDSSTREIASSISSEASLASDSAPPSDEEFTVPGFGGTPAIAVLAFDNLSGDPEQEYFADGLAEELITRLLRWRRFPVIARNSSFTYKGQAVNVQQVGRELGARYVVEGSVRKAGDRVRITAQLIDAKSNLHVWGETYDRELRDIFAVQDEIVEAIVTSIYPELSQAEWERAARWKPRNLSAYDLTMRGVWHFTKTQFPEGENRKARSFFEEALKQDPSYAFAWGGLASTHYWDIIYDWTDSPAASLAELDRCARACVTADMQSARCYIALSELHSLRGQPDEQSAALERAVSLDPSDSHAHGRLGVAFSLAARPDEAIPHLEKALRLDPKSPIKWAWLDGMSWAHFSAGRYEAAVDWAKQSVRLNPGDELGYRSLAASYAQLGRLDEARAAVKEELRIKPDLTLAKVRSQNQGTGTEPEFLERWLDGLRKAGLPE